MNSHVAIKTNGIPRPVIYGRELTEAERVDFGYLSSTNGEEGIEDAEFFRYNGAVFHVGEFLLASGIDIDGWDGYLPQTFFSGVLIRFAGDEQDQVVVGRYCANQ